MKYSKKIIEKICELMSTGKYIIPEICEAVGITEATFHDWQSKKTEFSEAILHARENQNKALYDLALSSLHRRIKGETYVDDYVNSRGEVKEMIKHIPPSDKAIEMSLRHNGWQETVNTNITIAPDLSHMSTDELIKLHNKTKDTDSKGS